MRPALASNPSARARFLREAQAAAAIEHDNIIAIHQVGVDRDEPPRQRRVEDVERVSSSVAVAIHAVGGPGAGNELHRPDGVVVNGVAVK